MTWLEILPYLIVALFVGAFLYNFLSSRLARRALAREGLETAKRNIAAADKQADLVHNEQVQLVFGQQSRQNESLNRQNDNLSRQNEGLSLQVTNLVKRIDAETIRYAQVTSAELQRHIAEVETLKAQILGLQTEIDESRQ